MPDEHEALTPTQDGSRHSVVPPAVVVRIGPGREMVQSSPLQLTKTRHPNNRQSKPTIVDAINVETGDQNCDQAYQNCGQSKLFPCDSTASKD